MKHLIRIGLRPWKQAFWSQWIASLGMGVLLFGGGYSYWIFTSIPPLMKNLGEQELVMAYLNPDVNDQSALQLIAKMRSQFGSSLEMGYVSASDFLKKMKANNSSLIQELSYFGEEMDELIPRYIYMNGVFTPSMKNFIQSLVEVESVDSTGDRYQSTIQTFLILERFSVAAVLILFLTIASILFHLMKTNANLLKDSISMVRLMGGSYFQSRIPGLVTGGLIGLFSGLTAGILWIYAGGAFYRLVRELSPAFQMLPGPPVEVSLILVGVAFFLGAFSSIILRESSNA
ncbi:MAG: hypothetical protein CL678_14885 [Bdellovibrionaceae bacterium]|nr:hypothetical protein [Pseudobdellovibrionaceae bacterium]